MPDGSQIKRFLLAAFLLVLAIYVAVGWHLRRTAKREAEQVAKLESTVSRDVAASWIAYVKSRVKEKVRVDKSWIRLGPDILGTVYYGRPNSIQIQCDDDWLSVSVGFGGDSQIDLVGYEAGEGRPNDPYHPDSPAAGKLRAMVCSTAFMEVDSLMNQR